MRLLLVEDEVDLADWLRRALTQSGFVTDHAADGAAASVLTSTTRYDAVVLDLELPDIDGLDWLRRLRADGNMTPVMILTARGALEDRVKGLNLGADDYLTKPFALAELEARLTALGRRGRAVRDTLQRFGRLTFQSDTRAFAIRGKLLRLTPRESAALSALMLRRNQPIPKAALAEKVFDLRSDAGPDAIEVVVHRLRKKLEHSGVRITTVRGLGYMLELDHGFAPAS